ncbi:MAG: hypothetical protein OCD76_09585 [Reichenbachiella sp.]
MKMTVLLSGALVFFFFSCKQTIADIKEAPTQSERNTQYIGTSKNDIDELDERMTLLESRLGQLQKTSTAISGVKKLLGNKLTEVSQLKERLISYEDDAVTRLDSVTLAENIQILDSLDAYFSYVHLHGEGPNNIVSSSNYVESSTIESPTIETSSSSHYLDPEVNSSLVIEMSSSEDGSSSGEEKGVEMSSKISMPPLSSLGASSQQSVSFSSIQNSSSSKYVSSSVQMSLSSTHSLAIIGEAGVVTTGQTNSSEWHTVTLNQVYKNPIVVMGALSRMGSDQSNLRIKDVGANSFKFQIDEWDYRDGGHITEDNHYVVIEAGNYILESGLAISAGTIASVGFDWEEVSFEKPFVNTVNVFSQAVTVNGAGAVATRHQNVGEAKCEIRIQTEENVTTHSDETVHWIAIDHGVHTAGPPVEIGSVSSTSDGKIYSFLNSYTEGPVFMFALQTTNDSDPAVIRYSDVTDLTVLIRVEEEGSKDSELEHQSETVGVALFSKGSIRGVVVDD